MTDTDKTPTPSPESGGQWGRTSKKRRRRWLFAGGLGLAALAFVLTTRAWAHQHHFGRVQSQQELRERLDHGADFVLSRVDATDLQRKRVSAILDQAAPGLFRVHQKGAELRRSFVDAVARGDRTAAEDVRRQGVALADDMSRQMLSVVEQSLVVLDDAQRAKVREHVARFAERHHPH